MSEERKDLVFIASGGRTGTNFFGEVLGRVIEDCHSAHEPEVLQTKDPLNMWRLKTFGIWEMVIGRVLGVTGTRVLGTRLMLGDIDLDTAAERLRRSRARWHTRLPEHLVIESNGPIWFFSAHLETVWPGSKLIGIIRDPRTWVRSFMNHEGRYDQRDRVDWFPPGRLTPAKLGQTELAAQWETWGTFEKLAWEWNVVNSELVRGVDRDSERQDLAVRGPVRRWFGRGRSLGGLRLRSWRTPVCAPSRGRVPRSQDQRICGRSPGLGTLDAGRSAPCRRGVRTIDASVRLRNGTGVAGADRGVIDRTRTLQRAHKQEMPRRASLRRHRVVQ